VIVIDDYQPIIYRIGVDPGVRIVQLWHASGAFKTVGYSRVGKPGGPDPFSRIHKNYTHAIVSSDLDVPFYAEAFGIPEANVVPTGIPRMDRFFDDDARAAGLAAARAAYPETEGRMTILFAPTFRGDGPWTASYDFARLDYAALHALAVEKDAVVIIRMHPFVTDPLAIPEALTDRLLDGSAAPIDVNDLLFAVDLLITDYSSIVFEYSTLGRPMLFFAYDLEEYIATRDFYVPFESFVPGRIVRTFPELLDAIRRDEYEIEKVAAFAARHFAHLDGGSTDRVIDQLIIAP
jgi:CDP-ribitol ribitolphosphotransferase / teichoic acid ribitol-phosphate polymerase